LLAVDGVYVEDGEELGLVSAPAPTRGELSSMVERIHARVMGWLGRRGLLRERDASNAPAELTASEALTMVGCSAARW
jgi:hypothetical protein